MSYGLKVQGSDAGGNFTVMDTDLNLLNMVVVDKGRASVISPQDLSSHLQPEDLLFVKRPTAPGEADFQSVTTEVQGAPGRVANFYSPTYYYINHNPISGVIEFKGGDYVYVYTGNTRGDMRLVAYQDWDVEFDYFIVRKASTIIADGVGRDDQYGIKMLTSAGEVSYDSRAAITNDTFSIETYLPPSTSYYRQSNYYEGFTFSNGCYVNIEWAKGYEFADGIIIIRGLKINNTSAYVLDGDVVLEEAGTPDILYVPNRSVIFAARLNDVATTPPTTSDPDTEEPPAPPSTDYSGTIAYDSASTFTEGGNIVFNATTNISAPYHIKVFRLTGSDGADGGDIVSSISTFEGTSQTISIQSSNDTTQSSRTVSYQRDVNYIGNSTVNRVSSYSRGVPQYFTGNYSRDRVSSFSRAYTRNITTSGEYTRNSILTRTQNRVSSYARTSTRNRVSNYTRTDMITRSETPSYQRTSTRNRVEYYGAETTYTGNFIGNYSNTVGYSRNYTRGRVSSYSAEYSRTRYSSYSRVSTSGFVGDYTRTRSSSFIGNYSRNISYLGNYSRDFAGNYTRSGSYTRARPVTFIGNYNRGVVYAGDYARTFTGNYGRTQGYVRTRVVTRTSAYAAEEEYTQVRTSSYTSGASYAGDFIRYKPSTFIGNYNRGFSYARSFTGNYGVATNYTRNTNYTRDSIGSGGGISNQYTAGPFNTVDTGWVVDMESSTTQVKINGYSVALVQGTSATTIISGGVTYTRGTFNNTFAMQFRYAVSSSGSGTSYTGDFVGVEEYAGGNYTRTRNSSYNRTVDYTRSRLQYFAGNYTRSYSAASFTRNFTGNYIGATVTYVDLGPGEGSESYPVYYARSFVGDYVGNYTRTVDYLRSRYSAYSRSRPATLSYTRNVAGTYTGNYNRTLLYTRTRNSTYSRNRPVTLSYSRTRPISYLGEYTRSRGEIYTGNYNRQFAGDYTGNYARSFIGNYARDFVRGVTYTRTSTVNYIGPSTNTVVDPDFGTIEYPVYYSSSFAGEYVGNYSRNLSYLGNYVGDYTRGFAGNFAGEYSRTFVGNFTGEYTGNYTRGLAYEGNYVGDYSRIIPDDYTRNRVSTFGSNYERTFTGNFIGNYVGDFASNTTATTSGTSELGWAGETFSIELRIGDTTEAVNAPRGSEGTLDSKTFTLYDNDSGTILSTTSTQISDQDATHEVEFNFSTEGNSSVTGRISTSGVIVSGPFAISSGANTITVNNVPSVGGNKTYSLNVNKGDGTEIFAGSYTVYRSATNDPTPAPPPTPAPAPEPEPEPGPGPSQPNDNIAV